jgi:hypothetical protein
MKQSLIFFLANATVSVAATLPSLETRHSSPVLLERAGECTSSANCPAGHCCSKYGYCGVGPEYCGGNPGNPGTVHGIANGSIYRYGDATECHHILRNYGAYGISTYFKDVDPKASFVAMPSHIFNQYGSARHNTLCGKKITITYNGVTRTGVVADRNLSPDNSIEMCLNLWTAFGGKDGDGSIFRKLSFDIAA